MFFSLVSKEYCIDINWYHFFKFQVIIWWIYGAITKQAIYMFDCLFFKGGYVKNYIFFIFHRELLKLGIKYQ